VIQGNALLMARIQLTSWKHLFQLFHYQWKSLVKAQCLIVAEFAGKPCPVSQKVQPVAFLH